MSRPSLAGLRESSWLVWLLLSFVLNHAGSQLVRPMVSYRALSLGAEAGELGWLAAAFSLFPLVLALQIGRWIDRYGEMRFLVAGYLLIFSTSFFLASAPSIPLLMILFAGLGLGHLTSVVSLQGLIARGSGERSYDRRFATLALSASFAQLVGPGIGGLVAGSGSPAEIGTAVLAGAVLALLALPVLLLVRLPAGMAAARASRSDSGTPNLRVMDVLRTPGIMGAILVSTTVLSAIDVIVAYLPALGEERAWAPAFVGGLLSVRAAASMASRIFLGAWSDRFGRRALLAGSMVIAAVGLLMMPFFTWEPALVAAMAVAGFGLGIGQPVTISWVAAVARPETRATALSVRLMGNRVGQMGLPLAAGLVAGTAGAAGVLGFTGFVVAISLGLVYRGLEGKPPSPPRDGQSKQASADGGT